MRKFLSPMIVFLFLAAPASAESINCPEMDYRLKRTKEKRASGEIYDTENSFMMWRKADCQYSRGNNISIEWVKEYPTSGLFMAKSKCAWREKHGNGEVFRADIAKSGEIIHIYCNTHLAVARIKVSRREATPDRQKLWIDRGYELLREQLDETIACDDVVGSVMPRTESSAGHGQRQRAPDEGLPSQEVDVEISDIIQRLKKSAP